MFRPFGPQCKKAYSTPSPRAGRTPSPCAGIAYVGVLLILMIVLAMGLAFLLKAATEAAATQSMAGGMRAEYLAEAAQNHATWRLLYDPALPTYAEAAAADQFYMVNFQGYRYGYNFRPGTTNTLATVRTIGVSGSTLVTQGWVVCTNSYPFSGILCLYGPNTTNFVQQRNFFNPDWANAANGFDIGTKLRWVLAAGAETKREVIVAAVDDDNDINAAIFNGASWSNQIEFTTTADENNSCVDVAYESVSGDAMLVGRSSTSNDPYYRTWNGTSWGATTMLSNGFGSGSVRHVVLKNHPSNDQVYLIFLTSDYDVVRYIWTGSAWGSGVQLTGSASVNTYQPCDVEYEQQSGDALAVYCDNSDRIRYATWNGSGSSSGTVLTMSDLGRVVKMAPHLETNSIAAAVVDADRDLSICIWKGTSWVYAAEVNTSIYSSTRRCAAVAWEDQGDEAITFFAREFQSTVSYRRWDNNSNNMGSTQTGPNFGAQVVSIQALTIPGTDQIIVMAGNSASDLKYTIWNGNGFDVNPPVTLDTDLFDVSRQAFVPVATQ